MSPFRSKPIKNSCEFHQKKGPDRDSENAPVRAGFNFRISSCFFYHLLNPYLHDLFASVQGVAFSFPYTLYNKELTHFRKFSLYTVIEYHPQGWPEHKRPRKSTFQLETKKFWNSEHITLKNKKVRAFSFWKKTAFFYFFLKSRVLVSTWP